MRVALYARYSSDHQRQASIADQFRLCREYVTRQPGWTVQHEYADSAMSGASLLRPQFQALLQQALRGGYDVVLAESLDRFSRDQEDTAGLFKRLQFAGVRIVTVAEGDIGRLHIGLKGTMNAMYLDELADKTRRGMRGRVEDGKSGGGLCYGYRAVKVLDGQPRGDRTIDQAEAATVTRIFTMYASGDSVKAIAKQLNREKVPGPGGRVWGPSTIRGRAERGTGILNNELYRGRLVWNKLRYLKDPETGLRQARKNPPDAWIRTDVPALRLIDDELWQQVKVRQGETRSIVRAAGFQKLREPKYVFSGMTVCGSCGGGFTLSSHDHLVCFNARERGTCENTRTIKRQEIEARVLTALQEKLCEPKRFARICRAYIKTINTQMREHRAARAGAARERVAIEQQIRQIIEAVKAGFRTDAMRVELETLETQLQTIDRMLEIKPAPTLHPKMADAFRDRIIVLAKGLSQEGFRLEARRALRGIVESIVIPPGTAAIWLEGHVGALVGQPQTRMPHGRRVGIGYCGGPQLPIPTDRFRLVA